jgi:hypothetical protein
MSIAGTTNTKPSTPMKSALWLGLTLALLLGIAGPTLAQGGPGGYGPGPAPSSGMRPWEGRHRMIARETLEGPPAPAILQDSIGLSEDQLQSYAQRYSGYMAETRPARDSLRTSMQAMRAAFRDGDRSGARSRHDAIQRQSEGLAKRDKEFEKTLKQSLSKDQQKRYDKWKDSQEAEHEHRQHRRGAAAPGNL